MRPKHLIAILGLLMLALPAAPAHAGGVVSVCNEAHLLAAVAGGGTVTFNCSGTINLTNTIVIAANTTIDGSGRSVTVSGNHNVVVFEVNPGVTLNLNGLTIANGSGSSWGGGVYNRGSLSVSNSTFSGNRGDFGGGISNGFGGTVTVNNTTFSGNNAGSGGGIFYFDGTVTVSNSTFVGNSAGGGGGIYNDGSGTRSPRPLAGLAGITLSVQRWTLERSLTAPRPRAGLASATDSTVVGPATGPRTTGDRERVTPGFAPGSSVLGQRLHLFGCRIQL